MLICISFQYSLVSATYALSMCVVANGLQVSVAFARKKAVAAERKHRKEQKDEAQRYLEAQQQLVRGRSVCSRATFLGKEDYSLPYFGQKIH